jgi:hypothetical protein
MAFPSIHTDFEAARRRVTAAGHKSSLAIVLTLPSNHCRHRPRGDALFVGSYVFRRARWRRRREQVSLSKGVTSRRATPKTYAPDSKDDTLALSWHHA